MTDNEIRELLRLWVIRAFGVEADETALGYGIDLFQGRNPIVRQD
jgi:hypothetical protein